MRMLYAASIASTFLAPASVDAFINTHEIFKEFHEAMQEMERHVDDMLRCGCGKPKPKPTKSAPHVRIEQTDDQNEVTVTIKPIESEQFDAVVNPEEDQLTIKTAHDTIQIAVKGKKLYYAISSLHEITTEEDEEKKEEDKPATEQAKKRVTQRFYTSSSGSSFLTYPVLLNDQRIEYNKEDKELVIIFRVDQKSKGKSVPVTIVDKKK